MEELAVEPVLLPDYGTIHYRVRAVNDCGNNKIISKSEWSEAFKVCDQEKTPAAEIISQAPD